MTNQKSTKRAGLVVIVSKFWGVTITLTVALGVVLGIFTDGKDLLSSKLFQPELVLKFDKKGPIAMGTEVNLSYSLPSRGHFSLWNITGKGELDRILPKPNQAITSITINHTNNTGERWLKPNKANSKEEILLLWTSNHGDHPPRSHYQTEAEIRQFIDTHSTYEWVEKIVKIQVLE